MLIVPLAILSGGATNDHLDHDHVRYGATLAWSKRRGATIAGVVGFALTFALRLACRCSSGWMRCRAVEYIGIIPPAMQQRQDANAANDKRYEREFHAHRQHVIAEVKRGRSIQDYEIAEYYGGERWYGGWLQTTAA